MWKLKNGVIVFSKRKPESELDPEIRELAPDVLNELNPEWEDEYEYTKHFGRIVGLCRCVPRGNERVIYARTPRRTWYAPYVAADPVPTDACTVIIGKHYGELPPYIAETLYRERSGAEVYVLRAAYLGSRTPPLPNDPRATEDSIPFWDKHALVLMDRHEIDKQSITMQSPWH